MHLSVRFVSMATQSRNYDVLNDKQKRVLRLFYDGGMKTTAKDMHETISRAADETGLSYERVKKWIGNERRKRKVLEVGGTSQDNSGQAEGPAVKGPPLKRATSGYNMFASKMLSSDECKTIASKSEKMSFVATKWQSLSYDEQIAWQNKAKRIERAVPSVLTLEEKGKQIAKSKKSLVKELTYLESLGCESAVLMYDSETGTVNQYGSAKGAQFLLQDDTVPLKFMKFFDTANNGIKKYTNADVRDLFNKKYSEACGKPGTRVPYLNRGFTVTGLPSGIEFRKPNNYGEDKVNKIMQCQENIVFHLQPPDSTDSGELTDNTEIQQELQNLLCKVIGQEKAVQVVTEKVCVEESDVEVTDLLLSDDEYQQLVTKYRNFFTKDAMTALTANYETCRNHEGYILPVYTDSDDAYWLFYFPGKLADLQNQHAERKIQGYWLNATKGKLNYELLMSKDKETINTVNIITNDDNSNSYLFLRKTMLLKNRSKVNLPESFHKSVYASLNKHGFI